MRYINHSNCMANSYLMSQSMIKWTTKQHPPNPSNLLNLMILKKWNLLASCGTQYSYQDFGNLGVITLIEQRDKYSNCPFPEWYEYLVQQGLLSKVGRHSP